MFAPVLQDATHVDPNVLDAFLCRVYPPLRCDFLKEHGNWWHRSDSNRFVVLVNGQIAGYCAVIPVSVWIAGRVHPALWWVDLIIAPEYRGQGLQTLFDQRVRGMTDLLLGFPNELAGIIHRKHGWGVREDAKVLLLPLVPNRGRMVRYTTGTRGKFLRAGALGLSPLAAGWRVWLSSRRVERARRLASFDANVFSNIFRHALNEQLNTTWRDKPYFEWRYKNAPHPEEYCYYLAGMPSPTHYLISRHLTQPDGLCCTRILDLFGDFNDTKAIHGLLTLAVQDAITRGSSQVTLVSSRSVLTQVARQLGFLFSTPFGFCWWSTSSDFMSSFTGENYWTLSDSDNDAPD